MRIPRTLVCALVLFVALCAGFVLRAPVVSAGHGMPANGWTIHIDAQKHFPNHPTEWAHHWCKAVAGGMLECQIYGSDDPNAPMVATEMIVQPAVYKTFDAKEQALWHWHKTEIAKVNAKMPDISAAEAKKMVEQITPTYGKVYVLYDPMDTKTPVGQPVVNNLEGNAK